MIVIKAAALHVGAEQRAGGAVNIAIGDRAEAALGFIGAVGHLDIRTVDVGAPELDIDAAVFHGGLNTDWVIPVVDKAKIRRRPADRGIESGRNVADAEIVAQPVGDFEICQQRAVIQCGADLTDAAADLLHHLAAGIRAGRQIARGRRALAEGRVIGKAVAGVEHDAVDGSSRTPDVVDTIAAAAGQAGAFLAQAVGKQHGIELLGGDLRLGHDDGDAHHVAVVGLLPQALCLVHVKVDAVDMLRGRFGLRIVHGVLRLAGNGVVQLPDIQICACLHVDAAVDGGVVVRQQRVGHLIAELLFIHRNAVGALYDGDVFLIHRQRFAHHGRNDLSGRRRDL